MSKPTFMWGAVALVVLGLAGFGGWVLRLPSATLAAQGSPVPQQEQHP